MSLASAGDLKVQRQFLRHLVSFLLFTILGLWLLLCYDSHWTFATNAAEVAFFPLLNLGYFRRNYNTVSTLLSGRLVLSVAVCICRRILSLPIWVRAFTIDARFAVHRATQVVDLLCILFDRVLHFVDIGFSYTHHLCPKLFVYSLQRSNLLKACFCVFFLVQALGIFLR